MENLEKGPGMRSDHLGITPKVLPLESFFHVLERESDGFWMGCVRFGGREKRIAHYKSSLANPTILSRSGPSATLGRTVRHFNFCHNTQLELPLFNFSQHWRTVRGPMADRSRLAQETHLQCIRG